MGNIRSRYNAAPSQEATKFFASCSRNLSASRTACRASDAHCGLGRAPTFSDNLVEVSRVN
jgi:hypothetical protein